MKGKEIIDYIHKGKMPDVERVRENCLRQEAKGGYARRLRLSTAAAAIVACLVFSTAAYAVGAAIYNRFDTGGLLEIVVVPYDSPEYQEQLKNRTMGYPLYIGRVSGVDPIFWGQMKRPICEEVVYVVKEMLEGQLFGANGEPFDLVVYNEGYYADARGHVLYNAYGCEIGTIYLWYRNDDNLQMFFDRVEITTLADHEEQFGFNNTYDDAFAHLGRDFRLPTEHLDLFNPPVFSVWENSIGFSVRFLYHMYWISGEDLYFIMSKARVEGTDPFPFYITGEITGFEVAGVPVFKINEPQHAVNFNWVHDGLTYKFYPPSFFTETQILDVIRSMVE
jgi:hypothetical protein